jgi:hypothetical protein
MGQSACYESARGSSLWPWSLALIACMGCASAPYRYCGNLHTERDAPIAPGEAQIERGRPAPVLDGVGWVVGVPAKIIMLDHRIDNHNVSPETEMRLHEYLACNGLDKVKVRVNEYDPWGEWKRLTQNESVGWPLRYTFGTFSVVGYTLLPGRVFGGDVYNPFTNTISLYSDVPAVAVYEGGHAKDYAQTEYKGLYALACAVPGVRVVFHDAHASRDALGYLQENGTPQDIKEGYRAVCPAYALNASGPLAAATGVPLTLPAVAAGHVVGQVKAASVHDQQPRDLQVPETHAAAYGVPTATATVSDSGVSVTIADRVP